MPSDTHSEDSIPFYPDHIRAEFRVALGILVIIIIIGALGLILPVGIGEPADPLNTPTHIKPEWYFLALYQLLKYVPKTTGAVAPVIALIILTLWPFLDRKPDKSPRQQRVRLIIAAVGVVILIALTILGGAN
jgi:quinol-cytochrome oxidoreductase complex cytochrome b subunit